MENKRFSAIIPAAGFGRRTGLSTPKQWIELGGVPVVVHVLRLFAGMPHINAIALALNPEDREQREAQIISYDIEANLVFCDGGRRRQDTVRNGLQALKAADDEIIVVHDAARPFCSPELISSVVQAAYRAGAALAAIPVTDTIKEIDRVGFVANTPKRTFLRRAQTPQAIRADILRSGLDLAEERELEITDDVIAAEMQGIRVAVVNGEESNFKITTSLDLEFAQQQINSGSLRITDQG